MAMRVISGIYRHRLLEYPVDNPSIRPTKDRIREAFFSSLGSIDNKVFLDLCAGCGSIGIEAISRGAQKAIFVDNNKNSLKFIKTNIEKLNITNYQIIPKDALTAIEELHSKEETIDIIYFDPPYESNFYEEVINTIFNLNIIKKNGVLAFEANRVIEVNSSLYSKRKDYYYGDIVVTVLVK